MLVIIFLDADALEISRSSSVFLMAMLYLYSECLDDFNELIFKIIQY